MLLLVSMLAFSDYRTQTLLWRVTLVSNPRSVLAHNRLGEIALDKKDIVGPRGISRRPYRWIPTTWSARQARPAL